MNFRFKIGFTLCLVLFVDTYRAAETNELFEVGRKTAAAVCQSCHLQPAPTLLDKETWTKRTLPLMAQWLGVSQINWGTNSEATRIREAGIFPPSPIVTEEQWRGLQEYFHEAAPAKALSATNKPVAKRKEDLFRPHLLRTSSDLPFTTLVKIDTNEHAVYVGDAQERTLKLISPKGLIKREMTFPSAPVDIQQRGSNLWVTLVGRIFPSDQWAGQLWQIQAESNSWSGKAVIEDMPRLAHTTIADLNRSGADSFILAGYGNRLGKLMLWEKDIRGHFRENVLSPLPGAIGTHVMDIDGDGRLDILLLRGQAREGVFAIYNRGDHFEERPLIEFPPAFGTAGWAIADFNQDGKTDFVVASGDIGDYPCSPRAYHGLRLFVGASGGRFTEAWSYPMNGAYSVCVADFDGDGKLDLMASSFFPDYKNHADESILFFRNEGESRFSPFTFSFGNDGRWLVMDAGDIDGDGDIDIVLGSFPRGPQTVPIPDEIGYRWLKSRASILFLENLSK